MNTRKCYLVVVTSAKTTTRADCSTCCIPNSPHFSHRHDMTLILRDLSFITPSSTNFKAKEILLLVFGLSNHSWGIAWYLRWLIKSLHRSDCRLILPKDFPSRAQRTAQSSPAPQSAVGRRGPTDRSQKPLIGWERLSTTRGKTIVADLLQGLEAARNGAVWTVALLVCEILSFLLTGIYQERFGSQRRVWIAFNGWQLMIADHGNVFCYDSSILPTMKESFHNLVPDIEIAVHPWPGLLCLWCRWWFLFGIRVHWKDLRGMCL